MMWTGKAPSSYFFGAFGGDLTLFDSHAYYNQSLSFPSSMRCFRKDERTKPSSKPSPVVAQLGTTNQILSLSCDNFSASVTSCGFIAAAVNF